MKHLTVSLLLVLLFVGIPTVTVAQKSNSFADEFLNQFNNSMDKLSALAEATPAETFSWSPGEGLMSIELVYMHIARYNYNYPINNLDMAAPEGVDVDNMEKLTGKAQVLSSLAASREYVQKMVGHMNAQALHEKTELYGRDVENWAVLFQLVAHMNEHLGQSIAYARMNDVKPPWSR